LDRYATLTRTFPDWMRLRWAIAVTPRHQPGTIRAAGYSIAYPDLLSIYAQFREIFRQRIYHFESVHPAPRILNVGGYVGMAVLYFRAIYPDARITTFEPDPAL